MAPSREGKTEPWHADRANYPPELGERAVRLVAGLGGVGLLWRAVSWPAGSVPGRQYRPASSVPIRASSAPTVDGSMTSTMAPHPARFLAMSSGVGAATRTCA